MRSCATILFPARTRFRQRCSACCVQADTLVAVTGKPYDTLEEVIGIRGERCDGSLRDFGVAYRQVDLLGGTEVDFDGIRSAIDDTVKAVLLQRSKGYAWARHVFGREAK